MFSNQWSPIGVPYINGSQCSLSCTRADTIQNVSLFSLNSVDYPNGFQLQQQMTQPYSIVGADIVYSLDQSQMQINLKDGSNTISTQTIGTTREVGQFGINYQVNCPSYSSNRSTYIASLVYKQKLNSNSIILQFQQQQLSSTQSDNLMGIAQIRLWTNCVQNCDVCTDSTNCQKCFLGFTVTSLPNGQRVCQQTQTQTACQANCNLCTNSIDNSVSICDNCTYGYYLNGSNVCSPLHACPINQMYSYTTNTCVNYTNSCYLQTSYKSNQWTSCNGLVDPGNYRCDINYGILFYEWQNYKLVKCGCPDPYCSSCLNTGQCYQCLPGYSIGGSSSVCTYDGSCPANYYYDSNQLTCQPICSANCDYCTASSCVYCKRDQNYYIPSSNKKNCLVCSIPNCSKCNSSGTCSVCNTGFYLSTDYLKCETCQVSNCNQCLSFSNNCLTCVKNYTKVSNQCYCKQINSCQVCSTTDGSICLQCYQGYTLNTSLKTCSCTLQGCSQCKQYDGNKCQSNTCISGYQFDSVSETCLCGVQNCAVCNSSNGLICNQCITGYQLIGNSVCQCNVANCSSCDPQNGNICFTCNSGYSLNSSTGLCESNIPFCQTNNTSDITICDVCKQYFTQNQNKTKCIPTLENCSSIDANNKCLQCVQNYILNTVNNTCSCQVENCQKCDPNDGSYCNTCKNYYIISSSNQKCISSINNCNQIDASGQCQSCINGYKLDQINNICICGVNNCSQCNQTDGSQCITCDNYYNKSPSNQECISSISNCGQIDSNGVCKSCINGYKLDQGSNSCICAVNNCSQCNQTDGSQCVICNNYYNKSSSNKECVSSISDCNQIDTSGQCQSCISGYKLDQINNICICGVNNCSQCNQTDGSQCITCDNYYNKSSSNKECISSINNCNQIDASGQCQSCISGYKLDQINNICICGVNNCSQCNQTDGSQCITCDNYYNKSPSNQECISSISNCGQIDTNGICKSCINGYKLDQGSNSCICAVINCSQCNQTDGSQCVICNNYYNKSSSNKECISSINNCGLIDSNGLCKYCINGYKLDQINNICVCVVNNCSQCNQLDGNKCDACLSNYLNLFSNTKCLKQISNCQDYNTDGSCQNCVQNYLYNKNDNTCNCAVQNCQNCNAQSGSVCDTCKPYYDLDMNKNNCTPSIQYCQVVNSSGVCTQCNSGFIYDSNNNTCNCGVKNCQQCNQFTGSICENCSPGYISNSQKTLCQLQTENCIQYDQINNSCIQCQSGYNIDMINKICVCSALNCLQCSKNDGSQCTGCQNNYVNLNNQCTCQVQNCSQCHVGDGLICLKCSENYFLNPSDNKCYQNCPQNYVFNQQILKCEQCQISNCQKCKQFDSSYCIQCNDGYKLDSPDKCSLIQACQVLKCKQCSTDQTKCQICQDNFELDSNQQCNNKFTNSFSLSQDITESGYTIFIIFNNQIATSNAVDKIVNLQISNFYNFQVTSYQVINNQQIKAVLQVNSNCKQNTLSVNFKDDSFIQVNNLQKRSDSILLSDFVILSSEQRQQAQAIKDTANTIQSSLLSTILPIAILGNFYVLFNMIDHTTFLYFLLFVNVRHPQNILNFCSIFQNFQMAFIPNAFSVYLMDQGYSQNYTPKKFLEQQCDAYYLNQAGQSIFIVACIMFVYFCLKIIYLFDTPFKSYILKKLQSGWEFCGFIDLYAFVQVYVFLGVLLQFFRFEFVESLSFINYSLFSVGLIGSFLIPACIFVFLYKCKDLTTTQVQLQFSSIVGGLRIAGPEQFKEENTVSKRVYNQYHYIKYNYIFLTIRKLLFCILLVFLHDYPYFQLTLIIIQNLLLSFYYLYLWPHQKGYENIRNAVSEYLLIGMQIILLILVKDDQDQNESQRFFYGWVFITLAITLMSIHFISVIIDFVKLIFRVMSFCFLALKNTLQFLKKQLKQNKSLDQSIIIKKQRTSIHKNSNLFFSAHLKTIASNLDQTFTSTSKKIMERKQLRNHSLLRNKKIRHILNSVNVIIPQEPQLVKFSSIKESQNNSFEHQKDDSISNFYNSGVFCSSTRSMAKLKSVVFQNNENKDEHINQKSAFYQMQSPPVNMGSFEYNQYGKSLIDQQNIVRGNSTFQKSSKFNSPNSSFQDYNDQSMNQ